MLHTIVLAADILSVGLFLYCARHLVPSRRIAARSVAARSRRSSVPRLHA